MNFIAVDSGCFSLFNLSALCDFSKYRRYPGFSKDELFKIFMGQCAECMVSGNYGFIGSENNLVSVACVVVPSTWETHYFGLPMGRVQCFHSDAATSESICAALADSIELAVSNGIRHFSVEIDIDDYKTINCFIKLGFEMMDIKRSYFTNRLFENPTYKKMESLVRDYRSADYEAVLDVLSKVRYETRFTRDAFLDGEKSIALYGRWFLNLIDEIGKTSRVLVFERHGRIVACAGIGEVDFSRYGVGKKIRSGSLYASSHDGVGGYAPVIYKLTNDAIVSHGFMEATISLNNSSAVRVVEGIKPTQSATFISMRLFKG